HPRLCDVRMADGKVLKGNCRDTLAAGYDDVLRQVGNLHIAVGVDMGDVAGVEIALLVEDLAAVALEIGPGDSRAADLEPSERAAVPGTPHAVVVGDLHLDGEGGVSLLLLHVEPGAAGQAGNLRLQRAYGAERAHLGHAPGVHDANVVPGLETFGHGPRAGRAANHDALE